MNTIIALLAPADDRTDWGLNNIARFVMFKVPFEEVLEAKTFQALEAATERQTTKHWRITVLSQRTLLEEGLAHDEDEQITAATKPRQSRALLIKTTRYIGNKWGGKYLRAPDIYFTILEKGRVGAKHASPLLVRLGDIAEVRRGFTTGANEFFYLEPIEHSVAEILAGKAGQTVRVRNSAGWEGEIETSWLRPVIKSPREIKTLRVRPEDLRYLVFMPPDEIREKLSATSLKTRYPKAWAYIQWGKNRGIINGSPAPVGRDGGIWDIGITQTLSF